MVLNQLGIAHDPNGALYSGPRDPYLVSKWLGMKNKNAPQHNMAGAGGTGGTGGGTGRDMVRTIYPDWSIRDRARPIARVPRAKGMPDYPPGTCYAVGDIKLCYKWRLRWLRRADPDPEDSDMAGAPKRAARAWEAASPSGYVLPPHGHEIRLHPDRGRAGSHAHSSHRGWPDGRRHNYPGGRRVQGRAWPGGDGLATNLAVWAFGMMASMMPTGPTRLTRCRCLVAWHA